MRFQFKKRHHQELDIQIKQGANRNCNLSTKTLLMAGEGVHRVELDLLSPVVGSGVGLMRLAGCSWSYFLLWKALREP